MTTPGRIPRVLRRAAGALALAALLAGCGSAVGTPVAVSPVADSCLAAGQGAPGRDTVVVALPGPLRFGEVPLRPSQAERFLAAHLSSDAPCGLYRLGPGDALTLVPREPEYSGPTILLQVAAPEADPRDLIDRGADVVITADAAALEYARSRVELRLIPLAWSATYALAAPPGSPWHGDTSSALRADLARDAVRAEARPAEPSGWREYAGRCMKGTAASARVPGIVVLEGDPVARGLAERLVALAAPLGPDRVIALTAGKFDSSLATGSAAAYIVSFSRSRRADCAGVPLLPEGSEVVPLIDVRNTAVLRSGVPTFLFHTDGTIRFVPRARP